MKYEIEFWFTVGENNSYYVCQCVDKYDLSKIIGLFRHNTFVHSCTVFDRKAIFRRAQ